MYQKRNSNNLIVACPLVFLAALYVPAPVQSQHPYGLKSAIVDRENPDDGQEVFTLDTYTMIEFAYVDDGISQVRALRADGTEKIARFRSLDYHTMISDIVIFDTGSHVGSPNRVVKCQFNNIRDAKEFFDFIRPRGRRFNKTKFGVNSVLQYDCKEADYENGANYRPVSAKGKIVFETITKPNNNRPALRRFIIRDDDNKANVVFTSQTFNVIRMEMHACAMMSIKVKDLVFKIFIDFEDTIASQNFYDFVNTNDDLDWDIPVSVPYLWAESFGFPSGD